MGFKEIVGHEDIIAHFKSSIETGNVGHAYIISGDAGSGKKALAYAFADTLECEAGGTEPCGNCQSCLQISTGNYPDIITVTHEKPNLISVDEVREQLVNTVDVKPYKGKYKIYVIPDAELLNVQAQNAILKTIEEPPAYAVILLLTTNLDKLLETVQSRCLKLQTKPIRERDVLAYLMNVMGLTKEKAYFCLDFAQGNLGKAIKLAGNEEYAEIVDSVVNVLTHIGDMDVETLGKAVKDIEQFKMSMNDYMDLMMMWYRDAMMIKITGNVDKILFKNEFSTLKKQAGKLTFKSIEDKIDAIAKAEQRLLANANFEVTIELLLLTLKEEATEE
ncbi:MAG: DNA polymerase III subunit [Wujia sp.]|nr:DNA polymerase III subunit [Wujia sp.]MBO4952363.1 DNA polymerase III subunit [Lachnospiraceae bacterium]MCI6240055.1 DNA polymerase III subunit [Clostridium sp.]MDD7283286.1 DNA polymerase III subunit [Clostridium sp.]MDY3726711.1 DNA polymerase III subunit [Wujia sp.]